MEKYRSTADPATGIHPFVPVYGVGLKAVDVILAPLMIGVRIPMLLIGFTLLFLSAGMGFLASLASKFLLLAFGASAHQEKVLRPGAADSPQVIVANHGSFLDVLYLVNRFGARSFVLVDYKSRKPIVLSPLKAVFHSLSAASSQSSTAPAADMKSLRAPYVIFPEGTTTNGRGVLTFANETLAGIAPGTKVTIVGFNYGNPKLVSVSVAYTVGSVFTYFLKLLVQRQGSLSTKISFVQTTVGSPAMEIRRSVSSAAMLPQLSIGFQQRIDFEAHWKKTQGSKAYQS